MQRSNALSLKKKNTNYVQAKASRKERHMTRGGPFDF